MERYGERVLGAPVNRGFGRAAWLGPIVVLIIGLGIIWVYLRRLQARRPRAAPEAKTPAVDAGLQARIEEELKAHRT